MLMLRLIVVFGSYSMPAGVYNQQQARNAQKMIQEQVQVQAAAALVAALLVVLWSATYYPSKLVSSVTLSWWCQCGVWSGGG